MRLAQYEILDRIGKGGMGVVYRARDTQLGRIVAIKVLPPLVSSDPERRSRFLREAQAAANLNHPNIATVYQFGASEVEDGDLVTPSEGFSQPSEVLFLAMEYIEGEDLQTKIGSDGLSVRQVFGWGRQVAEGLEAAHEAGVIHRDLKPNNIRLTHDGRVKILDFGLAKMRDQRWGPQEQRVSEIGFQTTEGMLLGTPPYMAPEQLKGSDVDHRSDLFALGVVLYQLLTGEPPYPADNLLEYVKAVSKTKPRPLQEWRPDLTPDQVAVVEKLLEQEPEDRFANATETAQALRAVGGTAPTTPVTLRRILPPLKKTKIPIPRVALVTAAVLVLALLAYLLIWYSSPKETGPPDTLAVLALENLTQDPGYSLLAKAQLDRIVSELQNISALNIVLPQSEMGSEAFSKIVRDLGIDGVLKGSTAKPSDELLTTVQLIDPRRAVVLWSQTYNFPESDLVRSQELLIQDTRILIKAWQAAGTSRKLESVDFVKVGEAALASPTGDFGEEASIRIFDLALLGEDKPVSAYTGRSNANRQLFLRTRNDDFRERAKQDALTAIRLAPDNADTHIALGGVLQFSDDYEGAIRELNRATELDPHNPHAWFELAITQQLNDNLESAEASIKRAIDLRPNYWDYWNQLGTIQDQEGQLPEAEESFRYAASIAPEGINWPTGNLLGILLKRKKKAEAEALASSVRPPILDSRLANNLGYLAWDQGDFREAGDFFKRAQELAPSDPLYARNVGDALIKLGDIAGAHEAYLEAVQELERVLKTTPQTRKLSWLALYAAKAGDCSRTAEIEAELVEEPKNSAEISYYLAQALCQCERPSQALAYAEQARKLGVSEDDLRKTEELECLYGRS